jgi:hypothetical protein
MSFFWAQARGRSRLGPPRPSAFAAASSAASFAASRPARPSRPSHASARPSCPASRPGGGPGPRATSAGSPRPALCSPAIGSGGMSSAKEGPSMVRASRALARGFARHAQLADPALAIGDTVDGGACHPDVRPAAGAARGRLGIESAVHLQVTGVARRAATRPGRTSGMKRRPRSREPHLRGPGRPRRARRPRARLACPIERSRPRGRRRSEGGDDRVGGGVVGAELDVEGEHVRAGPGERPRVAPASIIRCVERPVVTAAPATGGPIVGLGTKRPSMTST